MTSYVASVYGALIAMCALAGVFFGRYWWLSRDWFFLHLRDPTTRVPPDPHGHRAEEPSQPN